MSAALDSLSGGWAWATLGGAGVLAGFVNSVAGGGSMLTLPALMLLGLGADVANGTNRVAITMQSVAAGRTYAGAGELPIGRALALAPATVLGAGLGATAASRLPSHVLEPALMVTLGVVAVLMTVRPARAGLPTGAPASARPRVRARDHLALGLAGLYGGFLQAGVGFLLLSVLSGALGETLVRANAIKVVLTLALTAVALPVFLLADQVAWGPGLTLGVATSVGAWLGARFAVSPRGRRLLRPVVLLAVIASLIAVAVR